MGSTLSELRITSLFGRYNYQLEFHPEISILHGDNGAGKTTILHIIANLMGRDFKRFEFLEFAKIEMEFSGGESVTVEKDNDSVNVFTKDRVVFRSQAKGTPEMEDLTEVSRRGILSQHQLSFDVETEDEGESLISWLGTAVYFPAFRGLADAIVQSISGPGVDPAERVKLVRRYNATDDMRRMFGRFVPKLDYPSFQVMEERAKDALRRAYMVEAQRSDEFIRTAFQDALNAIAGRTTENRPTPELLENIRNLQYELAADAGMSAIGRDKDLMGSFSPIIDIFSAGYWPAGATPLLEAYHEFLSTRQRVVARYFRPIYAFADAVNGFLTDKKVTISPTLRHVLQVVRNNSDEEEKIPLRALSSGERQIMTMLFAATHIAESHGTVLIDEPELSLHLRWQEQLLPTMNSLLGGKQLIVCTHSPEIAGKMRDKLIKVAPLLAR